MCARGAGGRGALERYSDRVDALLRQLFADGGAAREPVAILALGGYGRRHLCLHSDIDLLVLFGGRIGAAEERFLAGVPAPALGSRGGRRPSGARARRLRISSRRTTRSSCWRCSMRGRSRVPVRCSIGSARCSTSPATHAFILTSLLAADRGTARAVQRDAVPARARREGSAGRAARPGGDADDCAADRPAAAAARPSRPGAVRRRRRLPAARPIHAAPRDRPQPERAQPRAAGAHRRSAGLSGRRAATARRAADERLLPACPHRRPLARMGAARRRRCRWGRTSGCRATASASSTRSRRRAIPASWIGAFQAAIDAGTEVTEEALSCIQQHVDRYRADDFFPDQPIARRCWRCSSRGPGSTRACRRCTTAGCSDACFPSSRRFRGAWCATSTTSTRSTSTRC